MDTRALHNRHHRNSIPVPFVIGHRGASGLSAENTLTAFRLAMSALGADGVEMDAQLSADGQPVVIHDRRVDRTTGGVGAVARFTADNSGNLMRAHGSVAEGWQCGHAFALWRSRRLWQRGKGGGLISRGCSDSSRKSRVIAPAKPARVYIELRLIPRDEVLP